jgi:hypothetical protein
MGQNQAHTEKPTKRKIFPQALPDEGSKLFLEKPVREISIYEFQSLLPLQQFLPVEVNSCASWTRNRVTNLLTIKDLSIDLERVLILSKSDHLFSIHASVPQFLEQEASQLLAQRLMILDAAKYSHRNTDDFSRFLHPKADWISRLSLYHNNDFSEARFFEPGFLLSTYSACCFSESDLLNVWILDFFLPSDAKLLISFS